MSSDELAKEAVERRSGDLPSELCPAVASVVRRK